VKTQKEVLAEPVSGQNVRNNKKNIPNREHLRGEGHK